MEREKRRKKENAEVDRGRKREREQPSEEEVEEFFAILRRMQVAVKYFENSNGKGDGRKLLERRGGWRELMETGSLEKVDGVNGERKTVVEGTEEIDLNTAPEAESNSSS